MMTKKSRLIDRIYNASSKKADKLARDISLVPIVFAEALEDPSTKKAYDKLTAVLRSNLTVTSEADVALSKRMRAEGVLLWQGTNAWAKSWPQLLAFAGVCLTRNPIPLALLALRATINSTILNVCLAGYRTSKNTDESH